MFKTRGKRGMATLAAAVAAVGIVAGTTPAGAATGHNLMLYVDSGISHIQIVPPGDEANRCVAVTAGKWTDAKFTVYEGQKYSFQALVFDPGGHGEPYFPCGGDGKYLGPSVDSPLTIQPTKTSNYWEKISLG